MIYFEVSNINQKCNNNSPCILVFYANTFVSKHFFHCGNKRANRIGKGQSILVAPTSDHITRHLLRSVRFETNIQYSFFQVHLPKSTHKKESKNPLCAACSTMSNILHIPLAQETRFHRSTALLMQRARERDCEDRFQRLYLIYHFHQPKQNQFC